MARASAGRDRQRGTLLRRSAVLALAFGWQQMAIFEFAQVQQTHQALDRVMLPP
jgi:hypothetical protein